MTIMGDLPMWQMISLDHAFARKQLNLKIREKCWS